jgi:hypothetical protein
MKHKIYTSIFTLFFIVVSQIFGQAEIYSTINGQIKISTIINGKVITATSNKLIISLDYNTALFKMKLDKSSLKTGIDSLNTLFSQYKGEFIETKGKMGVDYIETKSHPIQNFKVGLTLENPYKTTEIMGNGSLTHLGGIYSCMLNLNFQLNLEDLNIQLPFKGANNKINIQILQTILKRESD